MPAPEAQKPRFNAAAVPHFQFSAAFHVRAPRFPKLPCETARLPHYFLAPLAFCIYGNPKHHPKILRQPN